MREPVKRGIRRPGVKTKNTRGIVIEHGEVGDPSQIQNRPSPGCTRDLATEQDGVGYRRERGTLATRGDIARTEVRNDVPASPDRNDIAIPQLKGRAECIRDPAMVINRLTVRADQVDLVRRYRGLLERSQYGASKRFAEQDVELGEGTQVQKGGPLYLLLYSGVMRMLAIMEQLHGDLGPLPLPCSRQIATSIASALVPDIRPTTRRDGLTLSPEGRKMD